MKAARRQRRVLWGLHEGVAHLHHVLRQLAGGPKSSPCKVVREPLILSDRDVPRKTARRLVDFSLKRAACAHM